MYRIDYQPGSSVLETILSGFWNDHLFACFELELQAAVDRITGLGIKHRVLVDVSEMTIQSQPILERFRSLIEHEQPRPARIAFFAPTPLARMQSRRLVVRPDMRLFTLRSEALDWLQSTSAGDGMEAPAPHR